MFDGPQAATLGPMRLRAVPVEGGRVRVYATKPPVDGVITRVDEDSKCFDVRLQGGAVREFKLRRATGKFEHPDGSWIRFLY